MNVLSLFDGISCAMIALEKAGIKITNYFASEIDKYCLKVSQANYQDIIQLGDIKNINIGELPKIDLLIGGSPCQSLSIAKRQKESGLEKGQSILFWEYLNILNKTKPKYFILENVASMKKIDKDKITKVLNVDPIMINSALVSAQQRKRLYWTNIPGITQPKNKHIYLKDILENGFTEKLKSYCITATYNNMIAKDYFFKSQRQCIFIKPVRIGSIGNGRQGERIYSINGKSICLSANGGGRGAKTGLYKIKKYVRKLTPLECERLQTIPDNYTDKGISNTQRYKMIGNAFTVDVIKHILKFIK
jgi:DNA (cytosine-5)-methyltransferase 3A